MIDLAGFHPIIVPVVIAALLIVYDMARLAIVGEPSRAGLAGHSLVIASWTAFTLLFVAGDYSLKPVYLSSSTGLPLAYKIAASWANGAGSLLLFTAVISAAYLAIRGRGRPPTLILLSLATLSGLLLAGINGAYSYAGPQEEGVGINPLLRNPWVYPHPIATFIAYALIVATAAYSWTSPRGWILLASASWITLTTALVLGGVWSYETLGWGGYWAWDPVEVAQLIPWLLLTSGIHAYRVSQGLGLSLLYLSVAAVFLAIYIVRSGGSPLHSFASPNGLTLIVSLAYIAPFTLLALAAARRASPSLRTPQHRALLVISAMGLVATAVLVGGLLPGLIRGIMGGDPSLPSFDQAVRIYHPFLAPLLGLLLALIPYSTSLSSRAPRTVAAYIVASALASAIIGLYAASSGYQWSPLSSWWTNLVIAILAPMAVFSALWVGASIIYNASRGLKSRVASEALHLGLLVLVIGFLLSGPYAYNPGYFEDYRLRPGDSVTVAGYTITYEGSRLYMQEGLVALYPSTQVIEGVRSLLLLLSYGVQQYEDYEASLRLLESLGLDEIARGVEVGDLVVDSGSGAVAVKGAVARMEFYRVNYSLVATVALEGDLVEMLGEPGPAASRVELPGGITLVVEDAVVGDGGVIVTGGALERAGRALEIPVNVTNTPLEPLALYETSEDYRRMVELIGALGLHEEGGLLETLIPDPCQAFSIDSLVASPTCLILIASQAFLPLGVEEEAVFSVSGGGESIVRAVLRYDFSGEVQEVRGVVAESVMVRDFLSDVYITVYPSIIEVYPGFYTTSLTLYYIKELAEEDEVSALLAAGIVAMGLGGSSISDVAGSLRMVLELYNSSLSLGGGGAEIIVRVKVVPYVWLVWLGSAIMVLSQTAFLALRAYGVGRGG